MKSTAVVQFVILLTVVAFIGSSKDNCADYFHEKDTCPPFNYTKINSLCCGLSPGKMLHCTITENRSIAFGCLENRLIPPNYAISLEPKDSPRTIRLVPCKPRGHWYEPYSRNSSAVYHSYCTKDRINCSVPQKIMVCQGGDTTDNQCGCADGYEPMSGDIKCWKGFTDSDPCLCQEKKCPNGTGRNMTDLFQGQCSEKRVDVDYSCYPTPSLSTATTPSSTSSSSGPPPHNSSSAPPVETAATGDNLNWLFLLPLILPLVLATKVFIFRHSIRRRICSISNHFSQSQQVTFTHVHENKMSQHDSEGDSDHEEENANFLDDPPDHPEADGVSV